MEKGAIKIPDELYSGVYFAKNGFWKKKLK